MGKEPEKQQQTQLVEWTSGLYPSGGASGACAGTWKAGHFPPSDFSGVLFQQWRLASPAFRSVNSLAAAQGYFYSLVSVMQTNSFSSCSSFWLFVPGHIIPHLSTLNCILSPIIPSPSMIWAPLRLIAKLNDLQCLQKAVICRFEILLAELFGGLLTSITRLCTGRKDQRDQGGLFVFFA